jgi:hypothetical protein
MDRNFPDLIRNAIASDELEKAQSLWEEYAGWLGKKLDHHLLSKGRLSEAGELVEWARQMTLAQKAHLGNSVNDLATSVHIEQAYVDQNPPGRGARLSFLA